MLGHGRVLARIARERVSPSHDDLSGVGYSEKWRRRLISLSSCCRSTSEILSWSEGMSVLASSAVSQQRVPGGMSATATATATGGERTELGALKASKVVAGAQQIVNRVAVLAVLEAREDVEVGAHLGEGLGLVEADLVLLAVLDNGIDDQAGLGEGEGGDVLELAQLELEAGLLVAGSIAAAASRRHVGGGALRWRVGGGDALFAGVELCRQFEEVWLGGR